MQEYEFRPAGVDDDDLHAVVQLLTRVWPQASHLTAAYIHWLYAQNPNGPVIGFNAWSDGQLVGHYVVIPIRAAIHGQAVLAALSLNTAVHPEHQGRGLFTRLAQETYALAQARGVHHVIGVGNANSTPGFVGKLGFRLIGSLDAHILWRAPTVCPASEVPGRSWVRIWQPDDLTWRLRNPSTRYAVTVRRGCRQILAPTGRYGILAMLKLDHAADAVDVSAVALGPPPLGRLRVWLGRSQRVQFPPLGRIAVPMRLRPSPLSLVIRYLAPGTAPVSAETVEFEALDFDAY